LAGNVYPRLIYQQQTNQIGAILERIHLVESTYEWAFLLVEYSLKTSTNRQSDVYRAELRASQASLDNNGHYVTRIQNGSMEICPPGCLNYNCSACLPGFFYDWATSKCRPCGLNCMSCHPEETVVCRTCLPGSFLDGRRECLPCLPPCTQCNASASDCTQCRPGQFASAGQCLPCPSHCASCSDNATCVSCEKGFILSNGTCLGCSYHCSSCSPSDITFCTGCAQGFQLVAGKCQPCPLNCTICRGNICDVCIGGYAPNANGTCAPKC
jgi:hypothetical protein